MRTSPILDDIKDVRVTTPTNGQTLVFNNGQWTNATPVTSLSGASDVTITSPSTGEVLTYNGTDWVNEASESGPSDRIVDGSMIAAVDDTAGALIVTNNTDNVVVSPDTIAMNIPAEGIAGVLTLPAADSWIYPGPAAFDSVGNLLVAGEYETPASTHIIGHITKINTTSNTIMWSKTLDATDVSAEVYCESILVDSADNIYVFIGTYLSTSGSEILKFDSTGQLLWSRRYVDREISGAALTATGLWIGTSSWNFGTDVSMLRIDPSNGDIVHTIDTTSSRLVPVADQASQYVYFLTDDGPEFNIIAVNASTNAVVWSNSYDIDVSIASITRWFEALAYNNGSLFVSANTFDNTIVVVKIDCTTGNVVWCKMYSGYGLTYPNTEVVRSIGTDVYIGGEYGGVTRITTDGTPTWLHSYSMYGAQGLGNDWVTSNYSRGNISNTSIVLYGELYPTSYTGPGYLVLDRDIAGVGTAHNIAFTDLAVAVLSVTDIPTISPTSGVSTLTVNNSPTPPVVSELSAVASDIQIIDGVTDFEKITTVRANTVHASGGTGTSQNVLTNLGGTAAWAPPNLQIGPSGAIVANTMRTPPAGSNETAVGGLSLSTSAGQENVAIGYRSMYSNTDGMFNTAAGGRSLHNNTTGFNNVAVGYQALFYNTTGTNNTASGIRALLSNTTGTGNIASGYQALSSNTSGSYNIASGYSALYSNTTGTHNSALGYQAMNANISGSENTAYGSEALAANTTGSYNNAVGYQSLRYNTTGQYNTATGYQAMRLNTTGQYNTAVGHQSLMANLTGNLNVACGYFTLQSNSTGYGNVAVGSNALQSNTSGGDNTAVGTYALRFNQQGTRNVAVGYEALRSNTSGDHNFAAGYSALYSNTTGPRNIACGFEALRGNTTGYDNIATGYQAGYTNTIGHNNVATGYQALYFNTLGYNNVACGYEAMYNNTTGNNNTGIGYQVLRACTNGHNNIAIGQGAGLVVSSGNNNVILGRSAGANLTTGQGNVIIGELAGTDAVANLSNQSNFVVLGNNSTTTAMIKVAWTVTSDARDKGNIEALPIGLEFVSQLQPKQFTLIDRETQETTTGLRYGFIAQDIQNLESTPVLVDSTDPDNLKLKESMIVPVLTKAIQELSQQNQQQAHEISNLTTQLQEIKTLLGM